MRQMTMLAMIMLGLAATGCNTVRGAGEDARSVGRVFSDHPNRDTHPQRPVRAPMSIPWDKTVEFFHSGPSLNVVRARMTLHDAVAHFLSLSLDEQRMCGIGIHEAMLVEIRGKPAALGFLRPQAIRALAEEPGFDAGQLTDRHTMNDAVS